MSSTSTASNRRYNSPSPTAIPTLSDGPASKISSWSTNEISFEGSQQLCLSFAHLYSTVPIARCQSETKWCKTHLLLTTCASLHRVKSLDVKCSVDFRFALNKHLVELSGTEVSSLSATLVVGRGSEVDVSFASLIRPIWLSMWSVFVWSDHRCSLSHPE